jgi:hypothetical protein
MNKLIIYISLLGPYPTPLERVPCKHTNYDKIQTIIILEIHSIKSTYNVKQNRIEKNKSFIFQ